MTKPSDDEAQALHLLERHPDLLRRHPELLDKLELPHGPPGTASLVERRMQLLRTQLAETRARLDCLLEYARDYERLTDALHRVTLLLIPARHLEQVRDMLAAALREEFHAEAVALKLFPIDAAPRARDALVAAFLQFVEADRCLCGPLAEDRAALLFVAEQSDRLPRSAALIPLHGPHFGGVLAIGSLDENRFTAELGTDVLARLGAILSAKLAELAVRP